MPFFEWLKEDLGNLLILHSLGKPYKPGSSHFYYI